MNQNILNNFKTNLGLKFVLLSLSFCLALKQYGQTIDWKKCYGGKFDEVARSVKQTKDGGFIVAGYAKSSDGDITNKLGDNNNFDAWLLKTNKTGQIEWQKTFGDINDDFAMCVEQTFDSGYIFGGYTTEQCWVTRLNKSGQVVWEKTFGDNTYNRIYSVKELNDRTFVVAGITTSIQGDITGYNGGGDCFIAKLDSSGEFIWKRCLGGSYEESAYDIQATNDGGFIFIGNTYSNDKYVTGKHGDINNNDIWVVKLNNNGFISWQRCLGGSNFEEGSALVQSSDGGYLVGGFTQSDDGDVSDHHGTDSLDYWVVKLSSSGSIQWQRTFGGTGDDYLSAICKSNDGGYILGGFTNSYNGDINGLKGRGYWDFNCIKIDAWGIVKWQKCYGGSLNEKLFCITPTSDNAFVVAGSAQSSNGDVTDKHSPSFAYTDYWLIKFTEPNSQLLSIKNDLVNLYPVPCLTELNLSFDSEDYSISIYNQIGQKQLEASFNQKCIKIDVNSWQNGLYYIEFINTIDQSKTVKQFIKINP